MKALIFMIFAMLPFITASAQTKVFAKKAGKHVYYRIQRETGKPTYAQLADGEKPSVKNLLDIDNRISAKTYINIREAETEMLIFQEQETKLSYSKKPKDKETWLSSHEVKKNDATSEENEKEILVQVFPEIPITSSTPFKIDRLYPIFHVIKAKDPSLVGGSVICKILDRRKSNIIGSEGRIAMVPLYVRTDDGQEYSLRSVPIIRRGLNRCNVKLFLSPLIIPIFIPGTGAKILPNETIKLMLD